MTALGHGLRQCSPLQLRAGPSWVPAEHVTTVYLEKMGQGRSGRVSALLTDAAARRPVVVLAERDKTDMDRELRRELGKESALEWHTRCGAPHSIADLERVGAGQARTIILMHPELGVGGDEARRHVAPAPPQILAKAKYALWQGLPCNPLGCAVMSVVCLPHEALQVVLMLLSSWVLTFSDSCLLIDKPTETRQVLMINICVRICFTRG
jgi:hypothetical protein